MTEMNQSREVRTTDAIMVMLEVKVPMMLREAGESRSAKDRIVVEEEEVVGQRQ